ncbi:MAG: ribulose-phosphate 3-epimerase [Butyricicoccus sp.]
MSKIKISPSIFAADLATMNEQIKEIEAAGAELLHVDVMDGHFVQRMAYGADHIKMLRSMTDLPLDVHLMIDNPEVHIDSIAAAGADIITVHQEATTRLHSCMQNIHRHGIKAGVVLSPATSEETIRYLLDEIDMVLLMTVNPGEGGQHFLNSVVPKIRRVKEMIGDRAIDIEVDGSIDDKTIRLCWEAGANVFVSGGYLFKNITENMQALRKACE